MKYRLDLFKSIDIPIFQGRDPLQSLFPDNFWYNVLNHSFANFYDQMESIQIVIDYKIARDVEVPS